MPSAFRIGVDVSPTRYGREGCIEPSASLLSVGYLRSNYFLFAPRILRGQVAENFVKAFGHPDRRELLQRPAARFVTHLFEALWRAQQITKLFGKGGGFAR